MFELVFFNKIIIKFPFVITNSCLLVTHFFHLFLFNDKQALIYQLKLNRIEIK